MTVEKAPPVIICDRKDFRQAMFYLKCLQLNQADRDNFLNEIDPDKKYTWIFSFRFHGIGEEMLCTTIQTDDPSTAVYYGVTIGKAAREEVYEMAAVRYHTEALPLYLEAMESISALQSKGYF